MGQHPAPIASGPPDPHLGRGEGKREGGRQRSSGSAKPMPTWSEGVRGQPRMEGYPRSEVFLRTEEYPELKHLPELLPVTD